MAHVARADTLGTAWLLQRSRVTRGMPLLATEVATYEACRRMVREDSERFGQRCAARPTRHDAHELALADTRTTSSIDAEVVNSVLTALASELGAEVGKLVADHLGAGASLRDAALACGMSKSELHRIILRIRKNLGTE